MGPKAFFLFIVACVLAVFASAGTPPRADQIAATQPGAPVPLPSGYDVLALNSSQSPDIVTGPRSRIVVLYDPYRYKNASLTNSPVPMPTPDIAGAISQVIGTKGALANLEAFDFTKDMKGSVSTARSAPVSQCIVPRFASNTAVTPTFLNLVELSIPTPSPDFPPAKPTAAQSRDEQRQSACRESHFARALSGLEIAVAFLQTATARDVDMLNVIQTKAQSELQRSDNDFNSLETPAPDGRSQALNDSLVGLIQRNRQKASDLASSIGLRWDGIQYFTPSGLATDPGFFSITPDFAEQVAGLLRDFGDRVAEDSYSGTVGALNANAYAYMKSVLGGLDVSGYLSGGSKYETYVSAVNTTAETLARLYRPGSPADFALVTSVGACGSASANSVTLNAIDTFSGNNTPVSIKAVTVNCYARSYLTAGVGITALHQNAYAVTEHDYLVSGGVPPSPAPTFQTVYSISNTPSLYRPLGATMLNVCSCSYPGNSWNGYWTAGLGTAGQSPLVLLGYSAGYERYSFLTLAGTFGYVKTLPNGLTPNTLVPSSSFNINPVNRAQLGITFTFSVPVTSPH